MKIRRARKPECDISIEESVLRLIEEQGQCATDKETGGIMGGFGSMEEGRVIISNASDAGPGATHLAVFFSRDTAYCQRVVDEWASESLGKIDYLGEWHKHFEDDPKPSRTDLETLAGIAKNRDYHITMPLLFIIGNSNRRNSLRLFAVNHRRQYASMNWQVLKNSI